MKKVILIFFALIFLAVASFAQEEEIPEIPEAPGVLVNVTVAPGKIVCMFFVSAPSIVLQDEIAVFQVEIVNCGNQPIEGNASLRILNLEGRIIKERLRDIFLNRSLERSLFSLYFITSIRGTYIVEAQANWDNKTLIINRTFDVVNATERLIQRIPLMVPLKIIKAVDTFAPREVNASRAATTLVPITITNKGTIDLINVTIFPVVPVGWNATPAYISELGIDKNATRSVAVFPGKEVMIAPHLILYEIIHENETIQRGFFIVNVRAEVGASIKIVEYPPIFKIQQASTANFSFIIENNGNVTLTDITTKVENEEECLHPPKFPLIKSLDVGKSSRIIAEFASKDVVKTCAVTLIVKTMEGATDAVTTTIEVTPRVGIPVLILRFLITNWWMWILIIIAVILLLRLIITRYIYRRIIEEVTPPT